VIDCGGYRSSFDMILFPMVRFSASHARHRVLFEGRALEHGWQR
jgi:hypothetical protein